MKLPLTRGECVDGPRPCPHSTCRYHLTDSRTSDSCALDFADRVAARAEIPRDEPSMAAFVREHPDLDADEIIDAGRGLGMNIKREYVWNVRSKEHIANKERAYAATLEEVADTLGITPQYAGQIEAVALRKFAARYGLNTETLLDRALDRAQRVAQLPIAQPITEQPTPPESGVFKIGEDNVVQLTA